MQQCNLEVAFSVRRKKTVAFSLRKVNVFRSGAWCSAIAEGDLPLTIEEKSDIISVSTEHNEVNVFESVAVGNRFHTLFFCDCQGWRKRFLRRNIPHSKCNHGFI